MNHETALINAFVVPKKRRRLIEMLQKPKGRAKLLKTLYHFRDLDPRFLVGIAPSDQTEQAIKALLLQRGAPAHCHLISTDREIDGQDLPLDDALARLLFKSHGTLVSCIPGRLGYYEGENERDRFILERARPG